MLNNLISSINLIKWLNIRLIKISIHKVEDFVIQLDKYKLKMLL
jgi:hypothetical protein